MTYAFDPELAPFVEMLPAGDMSDVLVARAGLAAIIAPMNANVDVSGLRIEDHTIDGPDGSPPVLVRAYAPDSPAPAEGRPALLDIHGGGFVVGDIEMEHGFAAGTARELGAVIAVSSTGSQPSIPSPPASRIATPR